jgi:hypothetical protein
VTNTAQCTSTSTITTSLYVGPSSDFFQNKSVYAYVLTAEMAQSVQRLATGGLVRGSNPGEGAIFRLVQTGPEAHPASCTKGWVLPGIKWPERGADRPSPTNVELPID